MADDKKKDIVGDIARSGRTRIAAALAVTALVGGGLGTIMLRGGADEALLYSGLDLTESAEIAGKLDQANIRYKLRGDGSSIFVTRSQVLDARMMLSEEGLPTRGALGYEIFDKTEALGATSFVQNINRVRALEGELARTITSLDIVRGARVHLVLPERRLFERDSQKPSASVVLSVAGHGMTGAQVRAIRNLVAGSVPDLGIDRITVLDDKGRLLAAGAESEDGAMAGDSDDRLHAIEDRIKNKVLEVVESVTGPGAARVQVAAEVDFTRITQSSEVFDPDGRVLESSQTIEERSSEAERENTQTVTVDNNVPQGDAAADPENKMESDSSRTEETANYKISKTTKTEVKEGEGLQRLSVAVVVDDMRIIDEEGISTFEPRSAEELQRILTLVRSAVGFSEARGDVVEVVNMSFVRPDISMEGGAENPGMLDFDKNDILRVAELVILLIGGVVLILMVLRPLVKGLISPPENEDANTLGVPAGGAALPNVNVANLTLPDGSLARPGLPAAGVAPQDDLNIDVARISGQVKASSIKKMSEVVENHPDESLQIIRTWLTEEHKKGDAA